MNHDIFQKISDTAEEMNLEAYVVGGFVRDLFLKRSNKDIDVVCIGSGVDLRISELHKSNTMNLSLKLLVQEKKVIEKNLANPSLKMVV